MRFDEGALVRRLEAVPSVFQAAFAAACAERQLPAYSAFHTITRRGDPAVLATILSALWDDLTGAVKAESQMAVDLETCMGLIPREDDGAWVTEQAYAEDAAAAVAYALRARLSDDAQEAAWAARRAYEAADHFVINQLGIAPGTHEGEEHVSRHPIVQNELRRQERDLRDLESEEALVRQESTIREIRTRAQLEAGDFFKP